MKRALLVIFSLTVCLNMAQAGNGHDYWATDSAWFQPHNTICANKVDLLYFVATNVVSATDKSGNKVYRAQLTPKDKKTLDLEFAYVEQHIGQGDFNYIAPYYHQFTFEAANLPSRQFETEYKKVAKEVRKSFEYYMKHLNNGRRFALVGFSQGGMLVLDLLKHMTAKQYRKMVAAYALGYRVTTEDMKCRRLIPASDECTPGVTVSFNSALNNAAIWPLVAGGAATAINPVNWRTDSTSATFTYEGQQHKVSLDPTTHLLIVETANADKYRNWNANPIFQSANVPLDCLHHWDLLFYTDFIHDNILKRAERLRSLTPLSGQ